MVPPTNPSTPPRGLILARESQLARTIEGALTDAGIAVDLVDPESADERAAFAARVDLLVVLDAPNEPWKDAFTGAMSSRGHGRIIHVSDGKPAMAPALLARSGIKENWVRWSCLEEDGVSRMDAGGVEADPQRASSALLSALGRAVSCAEVAAAVVFLASPDAGYLVGAEIPVTGGQGLGLYPDQLR